MKYTSKATQPTVRQINAQLACTRTYCYVYTAQGNCLMRISRARTRKGVVEVRVTGYRAPEPMWQPIPEGAKIVLTYY